MSTSPLQDLARFLEDARDDEGVISFPPDTGLRVQQYRPSGSSYKAAEVEDIVQAIEGQGNGSNKKHIYNRFDQVAVLILCSIFMYSEWCTAQARGLCIISECLHIGSNDDALLKDQKCRNKLELGTRALPYLVKGVINASGTSTEQTRRWMGVLALELLRDCQENASRLTETTDQQWHGLTQTLQHGRCEVLRIIVGSLVRQLLNYGVPGNVLWSTQDLDNASATFPTGHHQDTQWINAFESYVEDLTIDNLLTQEKSDIAFAQSVTFGEDAYSNQDKKAIIATVSDALSIVIQLSSNSPALFIDIPIENITDVNLVVQSLAGSEGLQIFAVQIRLQDCSAPYLWNASPRAPRFVELTFPTHGPAEALAYTVKRSTRNQDHRTVVASTAVGVSRHNSGEDEDQENSPLGYDLMHEPTDLMAIAYDATTMIPLSLRHATADLADRESLEAAPSRRHGSPQADPLQDLERRPSEYGQLLQATAVVSLPRITSNVSDLGNDVPSSQLDANNETTIHRGMSVIENDPYLSGAAGEGDAMKSIGDGAIASFGQDRSQISQGGKRAKLSERLQNENGFVGEILGSEVDVQVQTPQVQVFPKKKAAEKSIVKNKPTAPMTKKSKKSTGKKAADKMEASEKTTGTHDDRVDLPPLTHVSSQLNAAKRAEEKAKDQSAKLESATAPEDRADEFAFPTSPQAAGKKPAKKSATTSKPAKKLSKKQKGSSTTARSSAAHRKPSGDHVIAIQVSGSLAHSRSQRAAALSANKKLQDLDDGTESGDDDQNARESNTQQVRSSSLKPPGNSKDIQHDTIEFTTATNETQQRPANLPNKGKARARKIAQNAISSISKPSTNAAQSRTFQTAKDPRGVGLTQAPRPLNEKDTAHPMETQRRPVVPAVDFEPSEQAILPEQGVSALNTKLGPAKLGAFIDEEQQCHDEALPFHGSHDVDLGQPRTPPKKISSRNGQSEAHKAPGVLPAGPDIKKPDFSEEARNVIRARPQRTETHPIESTYKDMKTQKIKSRPPAKKSKGQSVISMANKKAEEYSLKGARDPFASRLNAIPSNIKGVDHRLSGPSLVADKSSIGHTPQAAQKKIRSPLGQSFLGEKGSSATRSGLPVSDQQQGKPQKKTKRKADTEHVSITKKAKIDTPIPARPSRPTDITPIATSRKPHIISWASTGPRNQGTMSRHKHKVTRTKPPGAGVTMLPDDGGIFDNEAAPLPEDFEPIRDEAGPFHEGFEPFHGDGEPFLRTLGPYDKEAEPLPNTPRFRHKIANTSSEDPEPINDEAGPSHERPRIPPGDLDSIQDGAVPLRKEAVHEFLGEKVGRNRQHHERLSQQMVGVPSKAPEAPVARSILASKQISQTRVDANGSPMAERHPTNGPIQIQKLRSLEEDDSDMCDEPDFADRHGDYPIDEEPSREDPSKPAIPTFGAHAWVNVTRNTKQLPSSPHAPSVNSGLPVHHVYQSGEIVNPRTEEAIVPSDPLDPFVGEASGSSFNRLLRKATQNNKKRHIEGIEDCTPKKAKQSHRISSLEDPEQTLVQPPRRTKHRKTRFVEESYSSSSSSSSSALGNPSEDGLSPTLAEKDLEGSTAEWQRLLKPHQQNTLTVLTAISHRLLAHMNRSEEAFADMIKDFNKGGMLLIDHFEKDCQRQLDAHGAATDRLKQSLKGVYQRVKIDVEKEAKRWRGHTKELEAEWRVEQQALLAEADAALAVCRV